MLSQEQVSTVANEESCEKDGQWHAAVTFLCV